MSRQWDRLLKQDGSIAFARYLDTNGDGTGVKEVLGDYSSSPHEIFVQPAPGIVEFRVTRLLGLIRCSGQLRADRYGNQPELTNGIRLTIGTGPNLEDELFDAMDGIPVKNNAAWAAMVTSVTEHSFGSGDNFLSVRWEVGAGAQPVVLFPGIRMSLKFNDDFSGLVSHTFNIQGTFYPG